MRTSLPPTVADAVAARLRQANRAFADRFPGEGPRRQPIHTVYGGAHLFRADTAARLGQLALRSLEQNAPAPDGLVEAFGLHPHLAETVYPRIVDKLRREPVEDFRIDFEDGYGNRPDAEEDGHAAAAAAEVARGAAAGSLPPFIGIRLKPFTEDLRERSVRTLDIFLSTLVGELHGLPPNFVVTLPKVTHAAQVAALADLFAALEPALGLAAGSLALEIMVETPQSILGAEGNVALRALCDAGAGRCVAAHFGTYDYTASMGITAVHQRMDHPVCDFAKHVMQVALAGTGIWLSDGATNIMPVAPHVFDAWRLHYRHVRHSLEGGFYQGWDLHPAQLPSRYAAVFAFFLEGLAAASERLKNFVDKAAQATLVGDVFDDAATGQGLLNFFLRGINCGAVREDEALATGLSLDELRGRSFVKILENRRRLVEKQ